MSDSLLVSWRDNIVGELQNPMPDMWYLDGEWVSNGSKHAQDFEILVRNFDTKQVYQDHTKGTRALLFETKSLEGSGINAVIISLTDNRLFLRRVFEKEAIEWLVANVR